MGRRRRRDNIYTRAHIYEGYIRRCYNPKSECVVVCVLRGYVDDTTVALDDCPTLNGISIWCSEGMYLGGGAL